MQLRDWFDSLPLNERTPAIARIAERCGVTAAAVRHWRAGIRQVPATKCAAVSEATGGEVAPEDLRPEIFGNAA